MLQKCKFDPASDIEETVPELSIEVSEIMATHIVPNNDSVELGYSKLTDVADVGHYLRDKIQATVAAIKLNKSIGNAQTASTPQSTPQGE